MVAEEGAGGRVGAGCCGISVASLRGLVSSCFINVIDLFLQLTGGARHPASSRFNSGTFIRLLISST